MRADKIGRHDLDIGVLLFCHLNKCRNVPRHVRTRLHKEWNNDDLLCPLPDAMLQRLPRRRMYILQECGLHDVMAAALLDLGRDPLDGFIRASASAPMSQDY